jgi:hypothetical protein
MNEDDVSFCLVYILTDKIVVLLQLRIKTKFNRYFKITILSVKHVNLFCFVLMKINLGPVAPTPVKVNC